MNFCNANKKSNMLFFVISSIGTFPYGGSHRNILFTVCHSSSLLELRESIKWMVSTFSKTRYLKWMWEMFFTLKQTWKTKLDLTFISGVVLQVGMDDVVNTHWIIRKKNQNPRLFLIDGSDYESPDPGNSASLNILTKSLILATLTVAKLLGMVLLG